MNVAESAVAIVPSNKSPLAVVVRFPLFTAVPVALAATLASNEFVVATPEYSRMASRRGPETVSETVTVFAPLLIFSA